MHTFHLDFSLNHSHLHSKTTKKRNRERELVPNHRCHVGKRPEIGPSITHTVRCGIAFGAFQGLTSIETDWKVFFCAELRYLQCTMHMIANVITKTINVATQIVQVQEQENASLHSNFSIVHSFLRLIFSFEKRCIVSKKLKIVLKNAFKN